MPLEFSCVAKGLICGILTCKRVTTTKSFTASTHVECYSSCLVPRQGYFPYRKMECNRYNELAKAPFLKDNCFLGEEAGLSSLLETYIKTLQWGHPSIALLLSIICKRKILAASQLELSVPNHLCVSWTVVSINYEMSDILDKGIQVQDLKREFMFQKESLVKKNNN